MGYLRLRGRANVDSNGVCTVTLDATPQLMRKITHVRIWSDSTSDTDFTLYDEISTPDNALDVSPLKMGNDNVGYCDPPIPIQPGTILVGVWVGASVGSSALLVVSLSP